MNSSGLEHEPDSIIAAAMCGLLVGDTRCQHTLEYRCHIENIERKKRKSEREREGEKGKGDCKREREWEMECEKELNVMAKCE